MRKCYILLLIYSCLFFISCTTVKVQEPALPKAENHLTGALLPEIIPVYIVQETRTAEKQWELPLPEVVLSGSGETPAKTVVPAQQPTATPQPPTPTETPIPEKTVLKATAVVVKNTAAEIKKEPARKPVITANIKNAKTGTPVPSPAPDLEVSPGELYAKPGNEIEINLKNKDWIFPGFVQVQDAEGIAFVSRETGGNQTRFLFKTKKIGEYPLEFILQDNYTGKQQQEKYLVKVVPESKFYTLLYNNSPGNEASLETADTLFAQKKYAQALTEYLKQYDESSGYLNSQVAGIYELLGDYETAAKYWERNLEAMVPYNEQAVSGIIRGAVKLDDVNTVLKYLELIKAANDPQVKQDLIELAVYLEKKGKLELSLALLDDYRQNVAGGGLLDQVYFRLAALYEKDTAFRDLKKAREYYQLVYLEYPESEFSGASAERVKYLNRHFFYIW